MKDKLLSLLGICRKAGKLISGFDAAAESVKKGESGLVLTASDLSPKTKKEIEFITSKKHVETISVPVTIDEIGVKTGKHAGVLAITDTGLAQAVKTEARRVHDEEQRENISRIK